MPTNPPSPILHQGQQTLSLRQLDELNGVAKGTSFRHFKACAAELVEGRDYFHLDATTEAETIGRLKAEGLVYAGSNHLLLLTRSGYERIRSARAVTCPASCPDG